MSIALASPSMGSFSGSVGGKRPLRLHPVWVQWSLRGLGVPEKWEINVDLNGFICREFFGQGWMKLEKNERTPYIMKNTKHFNDVSAATAGDGGQAKTRQRSRPAPGVSQGPGCVRFTCPHPMDVTCPGDLSQVQHLLVRLLGLLQGREIFL